MANAIAGVSSFQLTVYRCPVFLRILAAVAGVASCAGAITLMTQTFSLEGGETWDRVAAGVLMVVGLGGLLINVERYEVSDQGLTWRVLGWRTFLRWDEIQRLALLPGGEWPFLACYAICTSRKPRWNWPRMYFYSWIARNDEFKSLIIARANLTQTSQPGVFSHELYERLTPAETLRLQTQSPGTRGKGDALLLP